MPEIHPTIEQLRKHGTPTGEPGTVEFQGKTYYSADLLSITTKKRRKFHGIRIAR